LHEDGDMTIFIKGVKKVSKMQNGQYVDVFDDNDHNILIFSRKLCILELMIKS